ncbi:MAG TPA: RNB domain-containing ribonuclease [Sphingomonadaceae bacterium]|nr:RNB domain-containing ribonuclease [Sphingomonadaceae bacterium]
MSKHATGLPSREKILDFIATSDQPAGKREIARAFGLHGHDKIALKSLLKDMADEGLIDSAPGRAFHKLGGVPKVTVLRVTDIDDSGQAWAVPERWDAEGPEPRLRLIERGPGAKKGGAVGVGDRVLARTEEKGSGFVAHPMKKLLKGSELVLGVVHQEGDALWLRPVDKKERRELPVSDVGKAAVGDLVLAEKTGRPPRITARVTDVLGDPFAPRSFSMIAIHKLGIPHVFSAETVAEAVEVSKRPLGEGREDLRHLPIVAIDPVDARDHDDAIWAEADPATGGWRAIVAIADVSFYVRSGSSLDKEARQRGNSVYFPDRVVPMLPEELSADICSLKEGEDRAALVCHLNISKDGQLTGWRFTRAVIRVAANIAYEDAQGAIDAAENSKGSFVPSENEGRVSGEEERPSTSLGTNGEVAPELVDTALKPVWACWKALYAAREKRAPLDLDLPERRVVLDEKGRILSVAPRERLDAHKLVEDFMIAANVAAAKALESRKVPPMYRVHEPPSREKLVALKDFLKTFNLEFALGQVIRPQTFNHIIERIGEADFKPQVMEQILRTQTQAYYAPTNAGHFGLSLGSYAHFTSPIRRYADLVVHRGLVRAFGLGEGGLTDRESEEMELLGTLISQYERRAMEAERDTIDRYVAAYLSERVGDLVDCRITGVQPFGFFATVEGLGGDGLVPVSTLGTEYFRYEEASQTLRGEDSETAFSSGQRLQLRLVEANPVSGGLRFALPEADARPAPKTKGAGRDRSGRSAPRPGLKRRGGPKRG